MIIDQSVENYLVVEEVAEIAKKDRTIKGRQRGRAGGENREKVRIVFR